MAEFGWPREKGWPTICKSGPRIWKWTVVHIFYYYFWQFIFNLDFLPFQTDKTLRVNYLLGSIISFSKVFRFNYLFYFYIISFISLRYVNYLFYSIIASVWKNEGYNIATTTQMSPYPCETWFISVIVICCVKGLVPLPTHTWGILLPPAKFCEKSLATLAWTLPHPFTYTTCLHPDNRSLIFWF